MMLKLFSYFATLLIMCYYTEVHAKAIIGSADLFEVKEITKPLQESLGDFNGDILIDQNHLMKQKNLTRTRRQLTDQLLREADSVRKILKQALDAAIYATDPNRVSSAPQKSRASDSSSNQSSNQSYVSNLLSAVLPITESPATSDSTFTEKLRTFWMNFLDNSKQMVGSTQQMVGMPRAESSPESKPLQGFQNLWLKFLETSKKILE